MQRLRALVATATAAALVAACWRSAPPAVEPFRVDRVSPALAAADAEPLLLNDSITVYFTAPVQPLSVTADTVTVFDGDGHPVRGRLTTGSNWVTFTPEPPLRPDLSDGSFRPDEDYRLVVAGYPRPDAVRASDGLRLQEVCSYALRTAPNGPVTTANGVLPAPLRPPGGDLPLVLHGDEAARQLPVDAPVLRLRFTAPVLPETVKPEAIVVQLLATAERLVPRAVRLVPSRLDPIPGSTIEVDLGPAPRRVDGGRALPLQERDRLSVTLAGGAHGLRDLAGRPVLPAEPLWWEVSPGAALSLLSWPETEGGITGDDAWLPGFHARWGVVRPHLRVEAGDGRLGVFRPTRDTVLRPGQPFDRGDGVMQKSDGSRFPFLAVDIPPGVRVRVEGRGARVLACGGMRIAGVLELDGGAVVVPSVSHGVAVDELLGLAPIALVAAGDIVVAGRIVTATPLPVDQSALTVASAGLIHLLGDLPYNTMLGVESVIDGGPRIRGARGQTYTRSVTFRAGVSPTGPVTCTASTPWFRMPADRDGGVVRFEAVDPAIAVTWQVVSADPVDPEHPDRRLDRRSRPRPARHGEWIPVEPGSFLRFRAEVEVRPGAAHPELRGLRLTDR